jgi:hypothetical protein
MPGPKVRSRAFLCPVSADGTGLCECPVRTHERTVRAPSAFCACLLYVYARVFPAAFLRVLRLTWRPFFRYRTPTISARVVKLVDTLGSGSSGRKAVLVQVQFRAVCFTGKTNLSSWGRFASSSSGQILKRCITMAYGLPQIEEGFFFALLVGELQQKYNSY